MLLPLPKSESAPQRRKAWAIKRGPRGTWGQDSAQAPVQPRTGEQRAEYSCLAWAPAAGSWRKSRRLWDTGGSQGLSPGSTKGQRNDGGRQSTRPAGEEAGSHPGFCGQVEMKWLWDLAEVSRSHKLLRDVRENDHILELCPVLPNPGHCKGSAREQPTPEEGPCLAHWWRHQQDPERTPDVSAFPRQQVDLRAFNKSSNKINFYSKCIGSTSSLVPRVPSTSPGSIH